MSGVAACGPHENVPPPSLSLSLSRQPSVSPESMDWLVRLDGRHHSSSNGDSLER